METGDVNGKLLRLRRALQRVKYDGAVDEAGCGKEHFSLLCCACVRVCSGAGRRAGRSARAGGHRRREGEV